MTLKLSDLVLKVSKDLANAITRKRCHQVFEIDTSNFNCFHLYFPTDLRTSAICRSTQRFTMRAPCTAVQWRAVIILVIRSKQ